MRTTLLSALALCSLSAHAADPTCPDAPVPGDAWEDGTARTAELAADEIAAMEAWAFPEVMDEDERTGVRTDGLIIARDGVILYERYGRDWTAEQPHLLWSATKSIANSLFAIAVQREGVELDASICDYVEVVNPDACQITPRHLIEFSSGFAWRESYEGLPPTSSSVIAMLYGEGVPDVLAFVTAHELRDPPGTSYYYSSGDTNVLSAIAHNVLEPKYGERYPYKLLFEPLGIDSALLERDGKGVPLGSSWGYMTPRDMARYATFLLHDGCWDGERILPDGWVDRIQKPASSVHGRLVAPMDGGTPGWNVWLAQAPGVEGEEVRWPSAPADAYGALGHWRQAMYVIPSEGLVVVRTGDDRDGESYTHDRMLELAVAVARQVPTESEPSTETEPERSTESEPSTETETEPEPSTETAPEPSTEPEPLTRWTTDLVPQPADGVPFAEPPDKYDLGLLKIASSYAARMACDCLYVSGRPEDVCKAYIKVQPNVARIKIKDDRKLVRARSLWMGKAEARYEGPETGCVMVVD